MNEHKGNSSPIFTAAQALEQRRRQGKGPRGQPPRAAILCFPRSLARHAARRYHLQPVGGFLGDVWTLKATRGQVALAANFGVGAPAAVALMEELTAFGVRQLISLGLAGGLQPDFHCGDLLVLDQARREEGTSAHYLPPAPFAQASPSLTARLRAALEISNLPYRAGSGWTTDAPYRETVAEVLAYHQAGLLCVDMEAAALFAAGQALGVEVAAGFVVADALEFTMDGPRWRLAVDEKLIQVSLERLLAAALLVLQPPAV